MDPILVYVWLIMTKIHKEKTEQLSELSKTAIDNDEYDKYNQQNLFNGVTIWNSRWSQLQIYKPQNDLRNDTKFS